MIFLETLQLTNFMLVESAEFDFSQDSVVLFVGDPAQGKSTVFEAVALCFTERKRGDSYKDFIKRGTSAAKVYLKATIYGKPITFNLEILDKKGTATVNRTIVYEQQTYTNSECSYLLESFDLNYLQHNMFSMQGQGSVTDLRPGDRAKLLKKILSVEFPTQLEFLNSELEKANQSLLTLQAKLGVYSSRTFQYRELNPLLTYTEKNNLKKKLETLKVKAANIARVRLLQQETLQKLEALKAQASGTLQRKIRAERDLKDTEVSLTKTIKDKETYEKNLAALPQIKASELEIKKLSQDQESTDLNFQTIESEFEKLSEDLKIVENKILTLQTHIRAHESGVCVDRKSTRLNSSH